MYSIKSEVTFDAAHRLPDYPGKCSCIHGHTYRAIFDMKFDASDINLSIKPFIMDFGSFKKIIKDLVDVWDHTIVLYEKDPIIASMLDADLNTIGGLGLVTMKHIPSAENMVTQLVREFIIAYASYAPKIVLKDWEILSGKEILPMTISVTLYETPASAITFSRRYNGKTS